MEGGMEKVRDLRMKVTLNEEIKREMNPKLFEIFHNLSWKMQKIA
jgi:hypothetical protein